MIEGRICIQNAQKQNRHYQGISSNTNMLSIYFLELMTFIDSEMMKDKTNVREIWNQYIIETNTTSMLSNVLHKSNNEDIC